MDIEKQINKLPIVEKAWAVSALIEEEYFYDMPYIYHGTRGQAKLSALPEFDCAKLCGISKHYKNNEWGHNIDEVGFLDLSCVRAKENDKVLFRGKIERRYQVKDILQGEIKDSYFDELLSKNPNAKAMIWKGSRSGYYGPNHCGYYGYLGAGIYSIEEAVKECKGKCLSDGFDVKIVDIEHYNSEINYEIETHQKKIDMLKKKIIN